MCFHSNQHPCAIKHLFISLHSKYQCFKCNYFPVMNSPVFLSLDDIYCIRQQTLADIVMIQNHWTRKRGEQI